MNLYPNFFRVFLIGGKKGKKAVTLASFSKLVNYSDKYLLTIIKKLIKKKIYIAYKWKRNYYVFLPSKPLKIEVDRKDGIPKETVETPSGNEIDIDWQAALSFLPSEIVSTLLDFQFNFIIQEGRLYVVKSSSLRGKTFPTWLQSNLGIFPAIVEYKYGLYILYDKNKMSTFNPGTNGTLKSTQIPSAFFELCRALDAAENNRNGANPGLPARRNLSTTASFDTGTVAVAATIPILITTQTDGSIKAAASDYLGGAYSAFDNGGGSLKSDNLIEAFLEGANLLAAAEKLVIPIEDQPNNIQIQIDFEAATATISANLPFTTLAADNGDVTIHAIDYLG